MKQQCKNMIEMLETFKGISFKTPSCPSNIGDVVSSFADYLKSNEIRAIPANQAIIVLRELLSNAMKHGNKYDKKTPVTIWIDRVQNNKFKITVKDLGCGFDYHSLDTTLPEDPKNLTKRGFKLVKAYTDSFEFNSSGNQVTAYLSMS